MTATDLRMLRAHSLTTVLQGEIEHLILSGAFAGGERLNENALAARFKVSRGPVREACRALAEKGLLELVPNRGLFIRRLSRQDAEDLYDIRAGLFALAARLLAPRITAAELAHMEELTTEMDRAADARSLDDYYPLNLAFHEALLDGSGNRRLVGEYRKLIKELHLFRARGLLQGGGLTVSNEEHREIVAALRRHDPIAAHEAAFRHVQNGKARMLSVGEPAEVKAS
ncbi:MAG: FCD domain-containing protein [Parvibaculaceae bacterium]